MAMSDGSDPRIRSRSLIDNPNFLRSARADAAGDARDGDDCAFGRRTVAVEKQVRRLSKWDEATKVVKKTGS